MFQNLKIVHAVTAVLLAFWLAFLGLAAVSWWALSSSTGSLRQVHDEHMRKAESLAQIALGVERTRLEIMRAFQHDPAGAMVKLHDHPLGQHFNAARGGQEKIDTLWQELQAGTTEPQERQRLDAAQALRAAWDAKAGQALKSLEQGDFGVPVMGAFLIAGRTEAQALMDALGAMRADQATAAEQAALAAQARTHAVGWVFGTLLVFGGLVGSALSVMVLRRLHSGFERAGAVAQAIAAGDLGSAVRSDSRDEIGTLLGHMAQMQQHLGLVIGQVRSVADGIGTASAQVAAGNADLSQRTERTAASLQQTAASTEELGATVRSNASHAAQASSLATEASNVAGTGGGAVAQVVGTMREINDSSRKIAEIIGTIDGIAFQTNILALNAAVEAARAGEQGRGFAVVAGEVRSLAQRSAEAAREIKSLIQASVERVETGSRQADEAGQTMEQVVASIRRVSDIVAEISQASLEQSDGVSQVGAAVADMDRATQQNAALVEQSAAAAESLRGQAQQLVQAVARFKLGAAQF